MINGPADDGESAAGFTGDRRYTAAFSDVWEAVLAAVAELRAWRVLSSDSREGTLHVETAGLLGRRPLEARLRVSLDEVGWTKLEMRMDRSGGGILPSRAPRRVGRLLGRVDRMLRVPRGGAGR